MKSGFDGASDLAERKLSAEEVRRLYDQHGGALLAYACSFVADAALEEIADASGVSPPRGRSSCRR